MEAPRHPQRHELPRQPRAHRCREEHGVHGGRGIRRRLALGVPRLVPHSPSTGNEDPSRLAQGAALPPPRRDLPAGAALQAAHAHDPGRARASRAGGRRPPRGRGDRRRRYEPGGRPGRHDRYHGHRHAGVRAVEALSARGAYR
jgi:hypothetical protein